MELGDLVWYLFVAIVVMAGRAWLLGGAYAIVLRISAVIILIFGSGFYNYFSQEASFLFEK